MGKEKFQRFAANVALAGALSGGLVHPTTPQEYQRVNTQVVASVQLQDDGMSARRSSIRLADKLSSARNAFVEREKGKKKAVKAYEVEQDVVVYRVLANERGSQEYDAVKRDLDAYTMMQLETHLGERLHVGISRFTHTIVDGELRAVGTDESMLGMLKRGRDYRREHGDPIDWDRETAEVIGFGRVQQILADPNTPVGTMMFYVSPPGDAARGSIYKNNFYDVHEKVSENEVKSSRYTSGLTPEESQQRLRIFDKRYDRESAPTDAEFLANPVLISPGTHNLETPDAIHEYMHVDHDHMRHDQFAVVIQACQPLLREYIQSLTEDPENIVEHKRRLDIVMNYADNVADELAKASHGKVVALFKDGVDVRPWIPPAIDRGALVRQKVRTVATGCGESGGESSSSSPYSVSEFDPGNKDRGNCSTCGKDAKDHHYHCPGCTRRYSDERHLSAKERTKKCNCGFEFGC